MERPTIHTLWTGGLDSTARIVYLSRQEVNVTPYYMIDSCRASTSNEIEAMQRITKRLRQDSGTKANIHNVIVVDVASIAPDAEISGAWKRLFDKYRVGSQYEFLARYAKHNDITLEIGIENGSGRAQTAIREQSKMVPVIDSKIGGVIIR